MTTLAAGEPVTVRLIKQSKPEVRYPAVVLRDDGRHVAIEAPWSLDARDLGFVTFEPGDLFTEHYWRDRWYAVKEVHAADGARKGWYCDITRPVTVSPGELVSIDLELDLWRSADGATVLRLDEDEFLASDLPRTDPAVAARARQALDELEALAHDGFATLLPAR